MRYIDFIFYFLFIPLSLIIIFIYPEKDNLILNTLNPTILSMLTCHYIHTEIGHLGGNILLYLLTMMTIFLNYNKRSIFYIVSIFAFLVFPFLASLFIISINLSMHVSGFSAIVSVFVGYAVYILFDKVNFSIKIWYEKVTDFRKSLYNNKYFGRVKLLFLNVIFFIMAVYIPIDIIFSITTDSHVLILAHIFGYMIGFVLGYVAIKYDHNIIKK